MLISTKFLLSLKNGLPYKYVVYSPRMITVGHQYEYLHGALHYRSPESNRLLRIPPDKLKAGGMYILMNTHIIYYIRSCLSAF